MLTTEYTVTGMSCGHCENAIRKEVGATAEVVDVQVSAANGILTIRSETPLDDAAILAAVDEAGYEAAPA